MLIESVNADILIAFVGVLALLPAIASFDTLSVVMARP
jgi:hypothetical protein